MPESILCLRSVLSKINIATLAFFGLVLIWYLFLHPFNLSVPLYVKWVSHR